MGPRLRRSCCRAPACPAGRWRASSASSAENAGREFIESEDEGWITGGWRSERWRFWHVFDHKTQNLAELLSGRAAEAARGAAALPEGARAALRLAVVGADLAGGPGDPRRRPAQPEAARLLPHRLDPRRDGVPDLRAALVPPAAIAGFGLTHFQFTNRGKPVVYHEDHAAYVRTLERFFFRKVSPEATAPARRLPGARRRARRRRRPRRIGAPQDHYRLKLQAQTRYAPPGALFFRDQFADQTEPVLAAARDPYVVLVGPPALARRLAGRLPEPPFAVLGEIFAPEAVDLGRGRDRARRPAARATRRSATCTRRSGWPGCAPAPRGARRGAGDALVAGRPAPAARRGAARPGGARRHAAAALRRPGARPRGADAPRASARAGCGRRRLPLGLPPAQLRRAVLDAGAAASPDIAGWLVSGAGAGDGPRTCGRPTWCCPGAARPRPRPAPGAGPSSPPRSPPAASATPPGSRRSPRRSPTAYGRIAAGLTTARRGGGAARRRRRAGRREPEAVR